MLDVAEHATGGQQRLAQCDDDEQLAAFGQVPLDSPVAGVRTTHAREREAEHRRDVFAGHRHRPQCQAEVALGRRAGQPGRPTR